MLMNVLFGSNKSDCEFSIAMVAVVGDGGMDVDVNVAVCVDVVRLFGCREFVSEVLLSLYVLFFFQGKVACILLLYKEVLSEEGPIVLKIYYLYNMYCRAIIEF